MQKTSCHHDQDHSHNSHAHSESQRDPVCGMEVKSDSPYRESVEGKTIASAVPNACRSFKLIPTRTWATRLMKHISIRVTLRYRHQKEPHIPVRCIQRFANRPLATARSVA